MKTCAFVPAEHAPLIEPHSGGLLQIVFHQAQLPLTGHGRGVSGALEHLRQRMFLLAFGK